MDHPFQAYIDKRQLAAADAAPLAAVVAAGRLPAEPAERDILQWVAEEYQVRLASLDEGNLDPQVLALFPVRVLLAHELLPPWGGSRMA